MFGRLAALSGGELIVVTTCSSELVQVTVVQADLKSRDLGPRDCPENWADRTQKAPHSFTARPGQYAQPCERATATAAIPTAVTAVVVFGVVVTCGIILSNLPKEKVAESLGADKV
jgi:hypothetical protein